MTKKIETQPVKVETPKIIIATAEYERIMLEAQNELEEEIKAYNAAVRAKNLDDMNKHNTACVAAKNRYNENARTMFYAECCNAFAVSKLIINFSINSDAYLCFGHCSFILVL